MTKRETYLSVAAMVLLAVLAFFYWWPHDSSSAEYQPPSEAAGSTQEQESTTPRVGESGSDSAHSATAKAGFKGDGRGRRQPLYSFEFTGNEVFPDRVLASAVTLPRAVPDRHTLSAQVERDLSAFYQRQGYLTLQILQIEVTTGRPTVVHCELSEGAQFRYGNVNIVSPDPELAGALDQVAREGSVVNRGKLRELIDEVTRQKQGEGYLDFQVRSEIILGEEPDRPDFKVEVIPSYRYTVGEIAFSSGVPPIEGIQQLSGFPFSRRALEYYLEKAGLPWEVVWLRKDPSAAVVNIRIRNPLPAGRVQN